MNIEELDILLNTHDGHHRARLQRMARRAMREHGLRSVSRLLSAALATRVRMLWCILGWMSALAFGTTASTTSFARWSEDHDAVRVSFAGSLVGQHGDMTYTIQGPQNGGWKSELAWPIQNILYGGGVVSARFWERFHINVGGWKSLNHQSGTMTDSDWFESLRAGLMVLYHDDTAIYGEFDTTLEALKFDGNLRVDLLRQPALTLGILAGYAYTQFEWLTGDGYQRSPLSAYNAGPITEAGIAYEERIHTPYIGLAATFTPQAVPAMANIYVLYSPLARCYDADDHLLRQKESAGVTQGLFLSFGSDLHLRVAPAWDVAGTVNYTRYALEGFQNQVFYGGTNAGARFSNIDLTLTGSQLSLGLLLRYGF